MTIKQIKHISVGFLLVLLTSCDAWENFKDPYRESRLKEHPEQKQQKSFSFPNPFQIFGGGIKNACLKFNEELSANLNANPRELVEKVNSSNKRLMDAVGITYYEVSKTTFDLEKNLSNIKGLIEAGEKCKKEGVTLDGVKK